MKFVDINNEKINAAFQFNACGFMVSVSTIMNKNNPEIVIFDMNDNVVVDNLTSMVQVMSWIELLKEAG